MKSTLLRVLNNFSQSIDTSLLINVSKQKFLAPVYHLVSDVRVQHIQHLYPIRSIQTFKNDLDYLLSCYEPINLKELIRTVHGGKEMIKNTFFLSFDDGLSECYHIIAPILKEKGVPATFFLNSAFIDNHDLFFKYKLSIILDTILRSKNAEALILRVKELFTKNKVLFKDIQTSLLSLRYNHTSMINSIALELNIDFTQYLKEHSPYLSTEQIQALIKEGHTIGAHSIDHPLYADLKMEDQLLQTKESVNFISNQFSLDYKTFAFPFTDFGVKNEFFDKMYTHNQVMVDLSFGSAGIKKDVSKFHIHRFPMERTGESAKTLINTELLYYICKMFVNKNRISRS